MNAIEVKALHKQYPGFSMNDINFCLPQGCILGLVGENGAGKSTLIKLIMNTIRREEGQIKVLGMDNHDPDFSLLKNEIGVVLDEAYFPSGLNAKKVGRIMKDIFIHWDDNHYNALLTHFKLPRDKAFKDFSRGMKMKLATAVALSHDAKLLILDEPTSGLDPMIRDEILDLYNDFTRNEDHTILISSHIVSDLEKICDYIAFLHNGRLLFFEEKDRLQELYGVAQLSQEDMSLIPEEGIIGVKAGKYGIEALVERNQVPQKIPMVKASLEDIIVYFAKGYDAQ